MNNFGKPVLRTKALLFILCLSALPGLSAAEYLVSKEAQALNLPFSEAVRVGNMLYLSGQIGLLPGTAKLAPGGIEAEAHQVMQNIRSVLERHGSSLEEVVKCTVMMADINEWATFNTVYVSYFPGPKPARSAFAASGIGFDGRVEVECWAASGTR